MSTSIICTDLTFAWPDGTTVFDGLDARFETGRTGLIGVNGSGKSTLLRLLAGELRPSRGAIRVVGERGYLPQNLTLAGGRRVDEILGVAEIRAAIAAIERGEVSEENFAVVGDRWDATEQAEATLDRLGLGHLELDRHVVELSGGETILLGLVAQFLRKPDVLLLDEPTNNLDRIARQRLYAAVEEWPGVMVIVSHDRELLELVDAIAELKNHPEFNGGGGELRVYGGNFSAYTEAVAIELQAAERAVRTAESDMRRQKRELADARIKLARRERYGKKMRANKREPKIVMGARKRAAQVSAGKHRNLHLEKLDEAKERLTGAEEAARTSDEIRVELPDTMLPAGRTVVTAKDLEPRHGPRLSLTVRGPERIALTGGNGTGKTTLLRTLTGELPPLSGELKVWVLTRYLPQRLDILSDDLSVLENVGRVAPGATTTEIRGQLARFLFRGAKVEAQVGTLSGGERFRAALATLLLAEPAPQLLILDEPTNNLDLASGRQLSQALAAYRGALIVASHDEPFLSGIGITRRLDLDEFARQSLGEEAELPADIEARP